MIYWILLPKAEDGCIKPYQCQVNSTCLELIYYIETLALSFNSKEGGKPEKSYKVGVDTAGYAFTIRMPMTNFAGCLSVINGQNFGLTFYSNLFGHAVIFKS